MDLSTAKKEAATRSSATKKDQYVNLKENGEHEISLKAGATPMLKFSNGSEVPLEPATVAKASSPKGTDKQASSNNGKGAAPKDKKPAPKKSTSKPVKVMKKVAKKAAKKSSAKVSGKHKTMTIKEILAGLKKGQRLLKPNGKKYNATKLAARADLSVKKEVIVAD